MNIGKQFESNFKNSVSKCYPKLSVTRLYDATGGYAVKNICDFILYSYPHQYFMELKAYKGNTINFKVLTSTQYNGLLEVSNVMGVYAGVLFKFNDYNEAYFVPIGVIHKMKESGLKSIHIDQARHIGANLSVIKTLKTTVIYDIITFINTINEKFTVTSEV